MSETRPTYTTNPIHDSRFPLPDFDEASMSQIPALLEVVNLGYTYIPRAAMRYVHDTGGLLLE